MLINERTRETITLLIRKSGILDVISICWELIRQAGMGLMRGIKMIYARDGETGSDIGPGGKYAG